jgi:hypothetical protein
MPVNSWIRPSEVVGMSTFPIYLFYLKPQAMPSCLAGYQEEVYGDVKNRAGYATYTLVSSFL